MSPKGASKRKKARMITEEEDDEDDGEEVFMVPKEMAEGHRDALGMLTQAFSRWTDEICQETRERLELERQRLAEQRRLRADMRALMQVFHGGPQFVQGSSRDGAVRRAIRMMADESDEAGDEDGEESGSGSDNDD